MLKYLLLVFALLPSLAYADTYGQSLVPTGTTKQIAATGTSGSIALGDSHGGYILVWNEGTTFAYVTCNSATATLPGGTGPNSTPVGPSGGILLYKPSLALSCAAITGGGADTVDFTPVNLF